MVTRSTVNVKKTTVRNSPFPSGRGKDETTPKNSTYLQRKTVHEEDVDNYINVLKIRNRTITLLNILE